MTAQDRKNLNHRVRKLVHGMLGLDLETYRTIVVSIDEKSEGHITRCDDEHANLVLLQLQAMLDRRPQPATTVRNGRQQRQIARLMQYLHWDWTVTAKFCHHQTGKKSTRLCDAKELSKVILGMVRIIDADIEKGKIKLSPQELAEYQKYTKWHRQAASR